jgi:hypothetical protein
VRERRQFVRARRGVVKLIQNLSTDNHRIVPPRRDLRRLGGMQACAVSDA